MGSVGQEECVETATAARHRLSKRGAHNFAHRDVWGPREKSLANPWSPDNLNGSIILRLAENSLLHQDIMDFFNAQVSTTYSQQINLCMFIYL